MIILSFIVGISNNNLEAELNSLSGGKISRELYRVIYLDVSYSDYRWLVYRALFIMSTISSAIRLKLLYNDLLPKVNQSNMKARLPKVIIIFKADENFSTSLLKVPLTSYFKIRIEIE